MMRVILPTVDSDMFCAQQRIGVASQTGYMVIAVARQTPSLLCFS